MRILSVLAIPCCATVASAFLNSACESIPENEFGNVRCTYGQEGIERAFTIPGDVNELVVFAKGGTGGYGRGARVAGDTFGAKLTGLTPRQTLMVTVGSDGTVRTLGDPENPTFPDGGSGGIPSAHQATGSGGGSTSIAEVASAMNMFSRKLVVAGGGAGGGIGSLVPLNEYSIDSNGSIGDREQGGGGGGLRGGLGGSSAHAAASGLSGTDIGLVSTLHFEEVESYLLNAFKRTAPPSLVIYYRTTARNPATNYVARRVRKRRHV